ncbi:putative mandelate racemase/muconate lactonizing enzyme [Streptomyces albus]|uniref:Putative mandelate racemase/muconate lactonizing enzyme n=1 Tax=Streptomyces albus (strain ATCC 21838 / DSM 41398 / FERM P-419 / JCM 4703 / NBRC 107858) TaxID=1081613 RepID=A0A0B5EIL3_STRA4|nr:putative mandelate racemase/muconate lactonizing enzyme [Streptomyces albus]AOU75624.1 putative mandelate racemase/muconate lactonizing enzyme [Streptomyces albus]AYN31428.1 mandelate racemase/muconate lactonizing enzyme, C-terminal domain protein [Streptomyces albus]
MAEALLHRVALPMRIRFDHPAAKRSTSDSLVLRLRLDGAQGLGECAPRRYVTGETTGSVTEALRRVPLDKLFAVLRGSSPADLLARLREEDFGAVFGIDGGSNLLCLLETAVLDLLGHQLDLSAYELLPDEGQGPAPARLPVSQVLDLSLDVEEFLDTRGPFHFVKIKAGDDLARDLRTVRAIRGRLGEAVPILVDANMSWTAEDAVDRGRQLHAAGAAYVEEPLPPRSWEQLRALRRESGLKVMLDESLCTAEDARRAVAEEACDVFNIRLAKNGGLLRSARLAAHARQQGLGFQFGVQVAEVGPLINAGRALAFRNPDALTVEGGQSDRFFPEMIVSPAPVVDRTANTLSPAPGPGLGLRLNPSAREWAALRYDEASGHWRALS